MERSASIRKRLQRQHSARSSLRSASSTSSLEPQPSWYRITLNFDPPEGGHPLTKDDNIIVILEDSRGMHFVLNPFGENSAKRRKSPDTCNPDILSHIIGKSDKLFPCAKTMPPRIWKDKAKRAEHVVFCGTDKIEFEVELTNPIAIMGIINRGDTIHKATKQLIRDVDNMHSQLLAKAAAAETQSCGERIVDAGVDVLAAGASVVHERAGKVVSALATLFKEVYGAVEDSKTLSAVCCFPAARTAVVDNMYLSFCAGVCADVHVAPPTATLAPPTPTAQVPADSAGRRDTAHALHGMAGMFLAAAAGAAVPVPASKPATQGDDDTVIAQATHAA